MISADQRCALDLWSQSESFTDIAAAVGLKSASDAERMVRAVLEGGSTRCSRYVPKAG